MKAEINRYERKSNSLATRVETLEINLKSSREREVSLESLVAGNNIDYDVIRGSQERFREVQKELEDLRSQVDDLILEIDNVRESLALLVAIMWPFVGFA